MTDTDKIDRLVSPKEAAALLAVSAGTLAVWRATKRYPLNYIKVGRLVRYREEDIREFIASRRVESAPAVA